MNFDPTALWFKDWTP